MINLSSIISKNFDFCRVDLYSHENRIYFGEITIHPEGGVGPFASKKMDYQFAKFLKIWKFYIYINTLVPLLGVGALGHMSFPKDG